MKQGMKYTTMIGFRRRATTVLVDPKTLFKFLTTKKSIPSFEDLLKARLEEDF